MKKQSYAELYKPVLKREALFYEIVLIIGASLLIALSAQIAFNVPLSPVPITGQTFAVIVIGALMGSHRGSLAVIVYLLEGISGLPVFAQAQFGIGHLIGPTGGYLMGFIPAAFICGRLVEVGWGKTVLSSLGIMTLGTIVIFLCGLAWLKIFMSTENVFLIGFYPYVTGALIKIIMATLLYRLSGQILHKLMK